MSQAETIGPYALGACLGEGAVGRVFRATDTRDGRPVAVKALRGAPVDATYDAPGDAADEIEASPQYADTADVLETRSDASAGEGGAPPEATPDAVEDATLDATVPESGTGPDADAAADGSQACPLVTASDAHYVDATSGVDVHQPWRAPRAPAPTADIIAYALAHSARQIFAAQGTYSAATGEVFPLVLTGRQGPYCSGTTIAGQGSYMSTRAAVVLEGTANSIISDWAIVGDGSSTGYCVMIESTASPIPHSVEERRRFGMRRCGRAGRRKQRRRGRLYAQRKLRGRSLDRIHTVGGDVRERFLRQRSDSVARRHHVRRRRPWGHGERRRERLGARRVQQLRELSVRLSRARVERSRDPPAPAAAASLWTS